MTPLAVGLIGIGVLLIFLFSRMPVGFVMAFVGFAGFAYLAGFDASLAILKTVPYTTFASYDLSVVPLFILMGTFCFYAGLSTDLYDTVHKWLGHQPGGLAMATVGACAGFAAVSGSSVATAATMGTVALPEMKRYNYSPALATGCIAAGGTIGILIPPSTGFIIFGIITEQSIGKLFLAGFIPGILEAVSYIVAITILTRRNPLLGPRGPKTSFTEKIASFKNTWVVILLFLIVMGGLYLGISTIPLIHPDYNLSYEEFAKLNVENGGGIVDEDVSCEFARDTLDRVLDLESYGIKVMRTRLGRLLLTMAPLH